MVHGWRKYDMSQAISTAPFTPIQGDYRFDVTVSSVLPEMPEIGRNMAFYTLPILVPMDQYYEIIPVSYTHLDVYKRQHLH